MNAEHGDLIAHASAGDGQGLGFIGVLGVSFLTAI
jgi:hypothetical protein